MIPIFLMRQMQWGSPTYECYSENGVGVWKELVSINDYKKAEYLIYVNHPDFILPFKPDNTFCYTAEPDEWYFSKHVWDKLPENVHIYHRPINHWHSFINYSDFKNMSFPIKTMDLSWATTNQGDEDTPAHIQTTEGQRLRMMFLKVFLKKYPNKLHLFGRGLKKYYPMQDFYYDHGEVTNLWRAIRDYRYNICFETSYQKGYFCKLWDAILGGCMPIYWGCPDLEKYLPKNSFIRVNLRKDLSDVADEIVEIVKSDFREANLDELEAAKKLLLDKWNIWEVFYQNIINLR